ncbi:thioredoxin TrxC [Vibrio sp. ZSDZ65]|uniref:Thioredoxin n=1 Tax=Vibrio qingdaonensis TaxID=2829491 RepID=A0A9X3CLP6_9VIBR|nr:thioredoxin TrxC [Vibrio qingdaonensis]MCW8345541.1 thioredoxin TrxC [Vibrio qingdaonensis]
MSTVNTRCPSCKGVNRIPSERIVESPNCGRCKSPLLDGAPIEGTADNFDTLLNSNQPIIVDFWAPWCNPCVGFAPVFEQTASEHSGNVRFVKIDTEAQQQLAARYQIRSIPTIMVFKNGQKVEQLSGALPKSQFDQWLKQFI